MRSELHSSCTILVHALSLLQQCASLAPADSKALHAGLIVLSRPWPAVDSDF